MAKTITKADLVRDIAEGADITQGQAALVLHAPVTDLAPCWHAMVCGRDGAFDAAVYGGTDSVPP